jgi:hypothetical protein
MLHLAQTKILFCYIAQPYSDLLMVEVSEIFYGFCKMFSSLGITSVPTPSTWKYRVYYFFDTLGRMLGYEVFTEDTFKKEDGLKRLFGKRIDMTWMKANLSDYVMALEYENRRRIDNDIKKLAAVQGLRILVMFRFDFTNEEIIEKIKVEENEYRDGDDPFLVLILPREFKRKKPFEKLEAILVGSKGKISGSGNAEGYVGKDGVCAFKTIIWNDNVDR